MWDPQRREQDDHDHRAADVRTKSHDDPAARILWLQSTAGNQAVARRLLQRADVTGKITHGKERHHPKYSYTFPGDQQPRDYDLDAWFTKKQGQSPMDYAAAITPLTVTGLINGWDGSQSIIRAVRAALVGTATWGDKTGAITGKHFTGQTQAGAITVNDNVAGTAQGQLFAQHFLSLESNIDLRVDDLPNNAITALEVESKPKVGATTKKVYRPDWNKVLREARIALKAKLLADAKAPEKDNVGLVIGVMKGPLAGDDIIELRTKRIIGEEDAKYNKQGFTGEGAKKVTHTVLNKTPDSKEITFNFGVNHLSTIIYMEWRAMDELKQYAQAGVLPQPQPVQVPVGVGAAVGGEKSED